MSGILRRTPEIVPLKMVVVSQLASNGTVRLIRNLSIAKLLADLIAD